jgi:geranyl-CoA carboxylase alpha subunit
MGAAAVAAARAIGYVGAGTVEFLLDGSQKFYFLEMNTRLQVEHPVTEAVTGLDLVAWQLRIAAGEKLPLTQQQVRFDGHAIEARLYAEDPSRNFLPQSGTLVDWRPASGEGIRVDHGLTSGFVVSPFYDPMLAKVIAHGGTREEARRRLAIALEDTVAFGLNTNRGFLISVVRHPAFAAGDATTAFIERYFPAGSEALQRPKLDLRMVAVAAILLFEARESQTVRGQSWSSTGAPSWPLRLTTGDAHQQAIVMVIGKDHYLIALGSHMLEVSIEERQEGAVRFTASGVQQTARYVLHDGTVHLDINGLVAAIRETTLEPSAASRRDASSRLVAPMNGAIISVAAKPGDMVAKGQLIVVLEAMKMQHEITAERDGTIEKILVRPGDQVATRQVLVELKAEASADRAEETS